MTFISQRRDPNANRSGVDYGVEQVPVLPRLPFARPVRRGPGFLSARPWEAGGLSKVSSLCQGSSYSMNRVSPSDLGLFHQIVDKAAICGSQRILSFPKAVLLT